MARRNDELVMGFAKVIRQRREKIGVSQEALAFDAELHRTYVSQLERGLKSPSLSAIAGLADALGVRPYQLVKAAEDQSK